MAAGLPKEAINFFGLSGQIVRLHDRNQDAGWRYDTPDLLTIVSRATYFEDLSEGMRWVNHTWPAFFLRAPADGKAEYRVPVPEQLFRDDVAGDSEAYLIPTLNKLMDAIEASKAEGGRAKLIRKEQLVPAPNDRGMRDACLNNYSYIPVSGKRAALVVAGRVSTFQRTLSTRSLSLRLIPTLGKPLC